MFSRESMAMSIGNISIQVSATAKVFLLMTIFLSNRESFPSKDLPYMVFIYIHRYIHMNVLVYVFVCMWGRVFMWACVYVCGCMHA